jgi:hypothetical protein
VKREARRIGPLLPTNPKRKRPGSDPAFFIGGIQAAAAELNGMAEKRMLYQGLSRA